MNKDINGFHHLGIISRNMGQAIAQYERLGFLFTPLTIPRIPLQAGGAPEPIGAGNRCAIFRDNYLEVLAIVDPNRWSSITREQRGPFDLDAPLSRYQGLHVLHLGTLELDHVRERLLRVGLSPSEIRAFQRMVDTPDGPQMMRARCLSFPPGSNPEALLQIAQHETPELVLQSRYMQHPNAAVSISEVIVCVADPDDVAQRYAQYTDQPIQRRREARVIEFGQSRILIASPDYLPNILPGQAAPVVPFLAGFTVSSDLEVTKRLFENRAIGYQNHEKRLLVDARDAHGTAVLFEDATKG